MCANVLKLIGEGECNYMTSVTLGTLLSCNLFSCEVLPFAVGFLCLHRHVYVSRRQ